MSSSQLGTGPVFRVLDLFSGTGAIGFGLNQGDRRFQTVLVNDINESACATAKLNHPSTRVECSPISEMGPPILDDILSDGPIDLVIGGPPCQGFSSLRPSRGTSLEDPRNILYKEFHRVVRYLKPKAFLLENVVGLVKANQGLLLEDLIAGFADLGFVSDWRILNSAQFGVPQKRERFFLLGIRGDITNRDPIRLPEPTHWFEGKTIGLKDRSRLVRCDNPELPPAITAWEAISDLPSIQSGESSNTYAGPPQNVFQSEMRQGVKALDLHKAAKHNAKMIDVMRVAGSNRNQLPEGMVTSGYSSCYSRISADEPAPTITVKFTSPASSKCIHPRDVRAITPREAARFQSFPDRFRFAGSKTDIASQIGNAVPPGLAAAFAPVLSSYLIRG